MAGRIKSDKYAGVYWQEVKRLTGKGTERLYSIVYKRTGSRKQNEDKLGRSSEGWTESKASIERGRRIQGKESNTEAREKRQKTNIIDGCGPLTIGRLWEIYQAAHIGNSSIRDDRNRYNRHIAEKIGALQPDVLTTGHIEKFRNSLEKYGLSPQSVKHCLGLIKRILRYAEKLGIITIPNGLYFSMPKVDNQKTETMSAEQLAAYLAALDAEEDQDAVAILRLALLTGMRRGAIFALKWQDIDLERGLITLQGKYAKSGKTAVIPINRAAIELLAGLPVHSGQDYVFPGKNGMRRTTFQKIASRVRDNAGLPKDFRPIHALRHVFASELASSGKVDLYTLQKLMTHGSAAMTQRYAHLADEALRKAANVANILAADNHTDNGKS